MPQRLIVFLLAVTGCVALSAQTPAATPPSAAAPQAALPSGTPPTLQAALDQLRSGNSAQALAEFQRILAADPSSAVANLYAATAALELYNGPLAVQYAEKARQLDPHDWKVDTTLVAAYSAAGEKQQRDALRAQLFQLHSGSVDAPDARDARVASGFLVEMFPVACHPVGGQTDTYHVDAIQYFEPIGELRTYYRFLVRRGTGPRLWEIDVQSNDFDEASWAQAHRSEAATGLRQFQINGHSDSGQEVDYRLFTGKNDYDSFRAMVVNILETQPLPVASAR